MGLSSFHIQEEEICLTYRALHLPHKVKTQYGTYKYKNIVDTSISCQISCQSTSILKGCMYIMYDIKRPLVMEEDWSSAHHFRNFPRQKKVLCLWSEMWILHFYFVGRYVHVPTTTTFKPKHCVHTKLDLY